MSLLNPIKNIYEKPTANIILNDERLKYFPLKVRNKKRMSALATSIQHCTEASFQGKWEINRNERYPNWKSRSIINSLFTDDTILCTENPKKIYTKKPQKAIRANKFIKVEEHKINIQNSIVFLSTSNE